MVLLVFPYTQDTRRSIAFTSPVAIPASPIISSTEPADSVLSGTPLPKPHLAKESKENVQASASYRSPKKSPAKSSPAILVSEKVQAENMLEQGYAVPDIAKELQLTKKEVRKLKRKLRKEEKAAIQQRKRDKKKIAHTSK